MRPGGSVPAVGARAPGKALLACLALALGPLGLATTPEWGVAIQDGKEDREEYAIKAQILVKLIPYVQWPEGSGGPNRPLIIAVVGRSPFEDQLDQVIRQSPILRGRPLKVVYVPRYSDDLACDLLFLCPSLGREIRAILSKTKGKPILTVADDDRLTDAGLMVNLLLQDDNRIKLVVNRQVAVNEHFVLSSQLLKVAKIIDTPRPTP